MSRAIPITVAVTGKTDVIAGLETTYLVNNGSPLLAGITGSGCMATAMTGCFLAVRGEEPLDVEAEVEEGAARFARELPELAVPWRGLEAPAPRLLVLNEPLAADLGLEGHASATWTSGAQTEGTRGQGYLRETFAYLYYLAVGG